MPIYFLFFIPNCIKYSFVTAIRKSVLWSETIAEDDEDEDSDVFGDDDDNDFDLEELEIALDNFLDKLESLVRFIGHPINLHPIL